MRFTSLVLIISLTCALGAYIHPLDAWTSTNNNNNNNYNADRPLSAHLSPVIVNELKEFVNLIPTAKLDALIVEHELLDGNFRRALAYVRGGDFPRLLQQLLNIPEIIEILNFLNLLVPDSTTTTTPHMVGSGSADRDDDRLIVSGGEVPQFDVMVVLLDAASAAAKRRPLSINAISPHYTIRAATHANAWNALDDEDDRHNGIDEEAGEQEAPASGMHLHPVEAWARWAPARRQLTSFTAFVQELVETLPRDELSQMIAAKQQRSVEFARFYAALRSPQLRPMVDAAMKSTNVAAALKTLNGHCVDVHGLEPIAFTVISWGPAP